MDTHRFSLNDLTVHAAWFIPRLLKVYPHLNERGVATWLRGVMDQADLFFQASDIGVSCVALVHPDTFTPRAVVQERFTWVADPTDAPQVEAAIGFYEGIQRWTKGLGIDVLMLSEHSDVPAEALRTRFKRIYTRQTSFLKV